MRSHFQTLLLSFAVLAAAPAFAQSENKLTFSSPASNLGPVLEAATTAFGESYAFDRSVSTLPVVVRLKDIEATAFRDAIAKAVGGQWTQSESGYRLSRPGSLATTLRNQALAARAQRISHAIAQWLDKKSQSNWTDESIKAMVEAEMKSRQGIVDRFKNQAQEMEGVKISVMGNQAGSSSASSIVLLDFVRKVSPTILAKIETGDRIVFSDKPNRMQAAMPMNLSQSINQFERTLARIQQYSNGYTTPENFSFAGGLELGATGRVAKTLVSVAAGAIEDSVVIDLTLLNQDGKVLSRAQEFIAPEPNTPANTNDEQKVGEIIGADADFLNALKRANPSDSGNSERSVVAGQGFVFRIGIGEGSPTIAIPDSARPFVTRPDQNEPLSSFVSAALLAYANTKELNFVACIGDDLIEAATPTLKAGEVTASQVINLLSHDYVTTQSDGVMVVAPIDRIQTESVTLDRSALAKIVSSILSRGYARLQDKLDFMGLNAAPPRSSDFGTQLFKFIDGTFSEQISGSNFALSKLLGNLPPQFHDAEAPAPQARLSGLAPDCIKWLNRIIFGRSGPLVMGQGMAIMMSVGDSEETSFADSTEQYPNGIPLAATLTANKTLADSVYASNGKSDGRFLTAEALGTLRGFAQNQPEFGSVSEFNFYTLAKNLGIELRVSLGEDSTNLGQDSDAWLVPNGTNVNYDQLPASFRKAVDETIARQRQIEFGTRSNRAIPPTQ